MHTVIIRLIVLVTTSLSFLVCNTSLFAQKSDFGNWFIYFGNQKINKRWNFWNEVQYRNYNFIGDMQQLLVRTGVGYNLTENNNNLLLGYAYVRSRNYLSNSEDEETVSTNEHRIYEQFITKQNFGRVFIQHRYRVEERFRKDNDFSMRLRYFLSLNIPLNHKDMSGNTFYLSTYDEVFLNTKASIFDRNRLYGGIGYVINKNFKVETGFMAQTIGTVNRNQLNLILFNNLPLCKK